MEFYLNNIYFSNGYYGIEAAARGYFGKSASELSVSQQAFIAAIPNNPTKYNPLTNYDATITRRNLILKELRDADYIDSMTYNTAIAEEITITGQKAANKNSSVETYARHCATEELMKYYGLQCVITLIQKMNIIHMRNCTSSITHHASRCLLMVDIQYIQA